jgi:hypothetical protein
MSGTCIETVDDEARDGRRQILFRKLVLFVNW